jgi:hypothetical protein
MTAHVKSIATILLASSALLASACETAPPAAVPPEPPAIEDIYPDIAALYGGEHGMYRGCGPNSGVCHNAAEHPNLRTLGALIDQIGAPCNLRRDDPGEIHEWCERAGDLLMVQAEVIELGWIEPASEPLPGDTVARTWTLHVREFGPVADADPAVALMARLDPEGAPQYMHYDLYQEGIATAVERIEPGVWRMTLSPMESDGGPAAELFALELERAGAVGDASAIQLGDPNRSGTYGGDLDNALIVPGAPERSYLIRRLVDPSFGTLMPLANCCYWTRDALRATWCWIAGLEEDGSNAREPIDYARCPSMPAEVDRLVYPTPGDACETSGMCPVRAIDPSEGASGDAVIALVRASCAGSTCHVGGSGPRLTIPVDDDAAYAALVAQVVPGDAEASPLYRRISPELCSAPDCARMPLGREPLSEEARALVRAWIEDGAPR